MKFLKIAVAVGAVALFTSPSLKADSVLFDFNSLANNASNGSVQSYMDGKLGAGRSVVVTGSLASNSYTGDGHVVGPKGVSLTLGTSDGGIPDKNPPDTFIDNVSSSTEIKMVFSGLKIYSVSFDYEIFPDGTCATGVNCGSNWPDFTFMADGSLVFNTPGVMPGNPGAPYLNSPASGLKSTEKAPQFLGQSGTLTFKSGVTKLEFVDWPATIGIDNLKISTTTPEPATMTLVGIGMLGLARVRRRLTKS
ncbi:MAG TPA: PEP-CTERM sorting domain-containing protein [Candidatus Saccharimonadales bacterium]|nr:PEP-CTERM sorting domain-containing protein [Candidatus Saccharimonadales bacterium]